MEELIETLREIQQRRLVLIPSGRTVRIWSAHKRVPRWIRETIHTHRREVLAMIQRSETAVCPNPALHRQWYSIFARYSVCDVCSRLRHEIVAIDTPV
jgi:hypothetical protein